MSKIYLKCLPVGTLPYEDDKLTTKMMTKLFENSPYLAMMPNASEKENLASWALENLSGIIIQDNKIIFDERNKIFKQELINLDIAFNTPSQENLEKYKIDAFFLHKYLQILKRLKPQETVINILGPFTFSQLIEKEDGLQVLADKSYRKFVIQAIVCKAIWIINRIKEYSPKTRPIIMMDDSKLSCFGNVKRESEAVTYDVIINMYSKIIQKIREQGGIVGVQCFEKCDWQIPIDAGVDIISFDAYNNPNNLNIIALKVNKFLADGGYINWGIVPVMSETIIKSLNIDTVYKRFISTVQNLIFSGVNEKLVYNQSLVSIQGDTDKLPLIFAEKALMLAVQLSNKIPAKN